MGDQHDLPVAAAQELGPHHGADLLRRVVQAEDLGGLDDLGLAAQRRQPVAQQRGDALHAFDVLAAGFDADQVAHGVQHGLPLGLGGLVHGRHGRAPGGGAAQEQDGGASGAGEKGKGAESS